MNKKILASQRSTPTKKKRILGTAGIKDLTPFKKSKMKTTITFALLLMSFVALSQKPFLTIGGYNQGVSLGAGVIVDKLQLTGDYHIPMMSRELPFTAAFTAGYRLNLNTALEGDYTLNIIPQIGIANSSKEDFTDYNNGGKIIKISTTNIVYGAELSKQWYRGILFGYVRKYENVVYGIGIRALIY